MTKENIAQAAADAFLMLFVPENFTPDEELRKLLGPVGADVPDDELEDFLCDLIAADVEARLREDCTECIDSWRDYRECMSRCTDLNDCSLLRKDYFECIHSTTPKKSAAATEPKKEDRVEEKEESNDYIGFGLFDFV